MTTPENTVWPMGHLSPSKRGTTKHFHMPSQGFEQPTRVCNAAVREPLNLAELHKGRVIRPGSDHSALPSKGGC